MTLPEWFRPGAYGVVLGAVVVSIVGFTWGGWMTTSSANKMAAGVAQSEVTAALVPVCVSRSQADPDQATKIDAITKASTYQRRDALMKTGWATAPGATEPDRGLADACLAALKLSAS
jgi:hypothetical protein